MALIRIKSVFLVMGGIALFLVGGTLRPTWANDTHIIPTLTLREDYNDNLFFTSQTEEDYITTISAGLIFFTRSERSRIDMSGAVAPFFYRDHDALNETDAHGRATAMYRLTPVVRMNLDAALRIDHRPDRDIDSTGLVYGTGQRNRYHGGAQTGLAVNETDTVEIAYDYYQDDWRDASFESLDFQGHVLRLGYLYDIGPRAGITQLAIDAGQAWYAYEPGRMNSTYGSIGVHRRLSELLRLRVHGGARYTDTQYDFVPSGEPAPETHTNTSWTGLGGIGVAYFGERTRCGLALSHDLRTTSSAQGPSNLTRGILNASRLLDEKLALGLSAGYYMNRAEADEFFADEVEEDTLSFRPYLRWQFYTHFALEGAYGYTALEDSTTDERIERHTVYLQIAYGYSLLEYLDVAVGADRSDYGEAYPWPQPR
jgi:hypothetical protein